MLEYDLHGMTTKQVLEFLEQFDTIDHTTKEVKFITGRGTHSKKPQMDFFCEQEWKCPIKKVVLDFIVLKKKQGARMMEYPTYILWKRRLN